MSTLCFDLPAKPRAVVLVRRRVLRQLGIWVGWLDDETTHGIEVIVSELLTNAVLHAGGARIGLTLRLGNRPGGVWLRIDVADRGHPERAARTPAPADQESGRGLALVEAFSFRSGTRPTRQGKDCWAELRIAQSGPMSEAVAARRAGPGRTL
ncbi:ATP-binding protein [Streptomyces sp. NPDC051546]|uniref:ATP-binding protein n=1 Tax=Streptomyces sp. NPDC051546 TaxID=3365655 RepID=UPI0037973205